MNNPIYIDLLDLIIRPKPKLKHGLEMLSLKWAYRYVIN